MRLELTGRHLEITPSMRRIIDGKLARLERLLNDTAVSAQVVLVREKTGSRADVTLHARGEKFLHGQGRGANVSVAMTEAVEKLTHQATTLKGKRQARKRRSTRSDVEQAQTAATAPPPPKRARVRMPRILNTSRQLLRTLSVGDAASELDGRQDPVVFRDAETGRIAVLYRSADGDLALIDTES